MKTVEKFDSVDVRVMVDGNELMTSISDVSRALGFSNPRKEVIKLSMSTEDHKKELVSWAYTLPDGEKMYNVLLVSTELVYELALRAENQRAKDFMLWFTKLNVKLLNREKVNKPYNETQTEEQLFNPTQIAESYKISAIRLNDILAQQGVQHKDKATLKWRLNDEFKGKGYASYLTVYTENRKHTKELRLLWTRKGINFIDRIMGRLGYVKYRDVDTMVQNSTQTKLF